MDLENLFKWKDSYIVTDKDGDALRKPESGEPIIVYLRVIGDNDTTAARRYSLKVSARLRQEYSKELDEIIPDLTSLSPEELVSMLIINEINEVYKQAERDTRIKYPADPRDLSLEEEERFSEETDTYFDRLQEEVIKNAKQLTEERKSYYLTLGHDRLVDLVKRSYLNKILDAEAQKAFEDAILYYCCFDDKNYTERSFSSIEAAANSAPFLKEQLIEAYNKLNLKDKQLKK